ncbi:MAG: hypothetical protein IJ727_01305 [Treponema sp.]|nr:hypothetical protein [Treponema sp.]
MKKTLKIGLLLAFISMAATGFIGCSNGSDDEGGSDIQKTKSKVEVVTADLSKTTSLELENYSYKIVLAVPAENGEKWTAELSFDENDFETDSDGEDVLDADGNSVLYELGSLSNASGTGSGSLTLYVYENQNKQSHSATLSVTYDGGTAAKTLTLTQRAPSANAAEETVMQKQFIGYGYNTRLGYASTLCRKKEIFKTAELVADGIEIDDDTVKITYSDDGTRSTYREASGSNIAELENSLKLTLDGKFDKANFSGEIDSHTEWTNKGKDDYQYAWADIKVTTWTAELSADSEIMTKKEMMKSAAYNAINGIGRSYPSTNEGFKKLIKDYGTHVVVGGYLGGKATITMEAYTGEMTGTFDAGCMIKAGYNDLFEVNTSADGTYKETLTNESQNFTFHGETRGGSKDAASDLDGMITGRQGKDDDRAQKFADWKKTLNESNNCVFVDFVSEDNLVPLYELIDPEADEGDERYNLMKAYFEEGQLEKDFPIASQSRFVKTVPTKIDLSDISFSDNDSLVKTLTLDEQGTVVAYVCNEYIPEINAKKRVTVVYPAANSKVYWNLGFYPGDDYHKPHSVGWNGSEVVLGEKSDLKYEAYSTLYLTGTTLTAFEPTWLSDEQKDKMAEPGSSDYKFSIGGGNGSYNVVKIENYLYSRDYYKGSYFVDGSMYNGADGSGISVVFNSYEYKKGEYKPLTGTNDTHYYPSYLYTSKWAAHNGLLPSGYTIPKSSTISGLVGRLGKLTSNNPNGSVAGMFMKDGVLGLNLINTGYLGYNERINNSERYFWEETSLSELACFDDGQGDMYGGTYSNATRLVISPTSGSVSVKSGVSHTSPNWAGVSITLNTDNILGEKSPCFPMIISMECK